MHRQVARFADMGYPAEVATVAMGKRQPGGEKRQVQKPTLAGQDQSVDKHIAMMYRKLFELEMRINELEKALSLCPSKPSK